MVAPLSTLHHMGLIRAKIDRLEEALGNSAEQLCVSIARDWSSGRLSAPQLYDLYQEYRALQAPRWYPSWQDAGLPDVTQLRRRAVHACPESGYWEGPFPFDGSVRPVEPVVYLLYDADQVVCYVGSTKSFASRLRRHRRDGKAFTYWQAYPAGDRAQAYEMESRFLAAHMPYLNKRRSA
jgi:hypothetical protein